MMSGRELEGLKEAVDEDLVECRNALERMQAAGDGGSPVELRLRKRVRRLEEMSRALDGLLGEVPS